VAAFIVAYILVVEIYNSSTYKFTTKDKLVREFRSIPIPNGSRPIDDMKLIDRKTFYYVTERFSSDQSADTLTGYYIKEMKNNGWNYLGTEKGSDHSSQLCKNGILGSLGFISNSREGAIYVFTLTTGGTAIRTCG
jgi:hypothetical protein